jgi:uncharacterized membrane protein YeaQ/YmgE (transglycosylase-associated protein family)
LTDTLGFCHNAAHRGFCREVERKDAMGYLWFLLIGLAVGCAAGCVAAKVNQAGRLALVGDLAAGMVGAVIGGPLFHLLMLNSSDAIGCLYIAGFGAIVSLCLLHFIKNVWKAIFGVTKLKGSDSSVATDSKMPRRWYQFSLRTLLLAFIPVALISALVAKLFFPPPVNVVMRAEYLSFYRYYDDHAGHSSLAALVRIINCSNSTVWFLENTVQRLELVNGQWTWQQSSSKPDRWASLPSMESTLIVVVLQSEKTGEMKVGVPFTTEWFPRQAHWVYTPAFKIVKKGQYYFPETKGGAKQEEQIGSLP